MSKREVKKIFNPKLPPGSKRVNHPTLGVRCWLIQGKYYRTRAHYLNPPMVKNEETGTAITVDLSLPVGEVKND